jgi:tetratricopeptide (TPR) repeat protein
MRTSDQEASNDARLKKAFADLQAGRLDAARREFAILSGDPATSTDAYRGLAAASWRTGQAQSAIEFLRLATQREPDHVNARADLAFALMLSGQGATAVPEWEKVLAQRPDDADAWHNFGKLLGDLGERQRATQAFERSLALLPGRAGTLSAYARMLASCDDPDGAEAIWRSLIKRFPDSVDHYLGLAQVQFERGRLEAARDTYRRGCEAVPTSPELHMGYAQLREDLSDRIGAEHSFREALRLRPGWAFALEGLLTLMRGKAEQELIAQARAVVTDPRRPPQDRANVGFGLGKVLDAQQRYDEAMDVWDRANTARRNQVGPYDPKRVTERVDRTMRAFTAELMAKFANEGLADERPVFIVGMPRSGTSLVEQIIAAHPQAHGYGELREVSRLTKQLPGRCGSIQRWPEAASALNGPVLKAAAADYIAFLEKRATTAAVRWLDKAPLNFWHVGLITLMFPKAHIVWCLRDPRDVCLSIYGENFALEQTFATSLEDLGRFYREYVRLMRYWQSLLPGRIYSCVYEELVADPPVQATRLVEATGLPWDDACLRFHEQSRPVLTPSRWQVRQPMYSGSIGRWRRYERWLAPLIRALGDEVPA